MPDLRKDPVVGRWVIIAPDRAKRPEEFQHQFRETQNRFDPFAEGNEEATPPEILAYREHGSEPNKPGWRVRVVPNKFPALQVEGELQNRGEGIYDMMNGLGAHEVIIECPQSETNMSRLSVENIREVFWAYRDRLVDLKRDKRFLHGLIFKNKGAAAGASLAHSHSQLIVTSVVPISIREEMSGSQEFYNYRGRCIYDDMLHQEMDTRKRIVLETEQFVVFCPFASRVPFETWIVPKRHSSHFESITTPALEELGTVVKTALRKLELALDDPPYNYMIHTAPFDVNEVSHYHWHMQILPRLTRVAGFEWGSGFYINPVTPEDAAKFLREVELPETL